MKKTILYLLTTCLFAFCDENSFSQSWGFQQKAVAPDRKIGQDVYGQFVVLNKDYAIISAWRNSYDQNGNNYLDEAGAVYLYQQSESGVWTFIKKIVASDRTLYDGFGYGMAADSNYVLIGAPFEGAQSYESAGAFYVFENKKERLAKSKNSMPRIGNIMMNLAGSYRYQGIGYLRVLPGMGKMKMGKTPYLGQARLTCIIVLAMNGCFRRK